MVGNVYDMLREKARSMGHAAADLPDEMWQKYLDKKDKRATLREAKLYVENYMMGNIEPADFAQALAKNDSLRYTISDLCRMRLEPVNLDIEHNGGYIDIGAGAKTFWKEIRVPLPSEIDAARDIRNIHIGIEAGRKSQARNASNNNLMNFSPNDTLETEDTRRFGKIRSLREKLSDAKNRMAEKAAEKGSLRDRLSDARRHMAEKAIEKLTPIAEGEKKEKSEAKFAYDPQIEDLVASEQAEKMDEAWLETEEGQEYKDRITRKAAQQLENITMDVEASKDMGLHPDERKNALEAAGVPTEEVGNLILDGDCHEYGKLVDDYLNQTGEDIGDLKLTVYVPAKEEDDSLFTESDMEVMDEAEQGKDEPMWVDESELADSEKEARQESEIETENPQAVNEESARPLKSDYTAEELNASLNDDMKKLFDQIMRHVNNDRQAGRHAAAQGNSESKDNGRIQGTFNGEPVSFKNSWSDHTFTKDEADKLLAGEKISFDHTDKNGEQRTVSGKLETQEFKGRSFVRFKADFSKQNTQSSVVLPEETDDAMMHYEMGGQSDESEADYYAHMAEDMAAYQREDAYLNYEEEEAPELSAEDCALLFDEGIKM